MVYLLSAIGLCLNLLPDPALGQRRCALDPLPQRHKERLPNPEDIPNSNNLVNITELAYTYY